MRLIFGGLVDSVHIPTDETDGWCPTGGRQISARVALVRGTVRRGPVAAPGE